MHPLNAALGLLSISLLSCCCCRQTPVNTVSPVVPDSRPRFLNERQVIMDGTLARQVRVDYVNTGDVNDLLRVQLKLTNTTHKALSVEYRFDWVDQNGMHVDTPASRWVIRRLQGGEPVFVTAMAPVPAARDFVFKLKRR